jgi:hypothetical protein
MKNLIPHQLHLTEKQIRNLSNGKTTTIPHSYMGSGAGETVVMLNPSNASKILSAYKKGKGMRLNLNTDELKGSMISGRGFKSVGKTIKKGFNEKIRDSGVGKKIAKELIDVGTKYVLPGAVSGLSMLAGDPTGMSGAMLGGIAGDQLDRYAESKGYGINEKMARLRAMRGKGLYKGLAKVGIKKRPAANALKVLGKEALKNATTVASQAISSYTGNPVAGEMFKQAVDQSGDNMIQKGFSKGKKMSKADAMRYGVELVDSYVDSNFSGMQKKAIEDALAGKFESAKDLIYDKVAMRRRGRPRKDAIGTGASMSKAYKKALKANYSGLELNNIGTNNEPISKFKVNPRVRPSSTEMTLSPYQSNTSPAMNPFVPTSYFQEGGTKCGYGGSGLYMPSGRGLY